MFVVVVVGGNEWRLACVLAWEIVCETRGGRGGRESEDMHECLGHGSGGAEMDREGAREMTGSRECIRGFEDGNFHRWTC